MASSMLARTALLAALVQCAARPLPQQKPFEATALLEEKTREAAGQGHRGSDDLLSLKKEIVNLKADKRGLVIALRKLLKVNQTEKDQKVIIAVHHAEEEKKKETEELTKEQAADNLIIGSLKKKQWGADQKLKQEESKLAALTNKEAAESAELQALRPQTETIATLQAKNSKVHAEITSLHRQVQLDADATKTLEAQLVQLKSKDEGLRLKKQHLEEKLVHENGSMASKTKLLVAEGRVANMNLALKSEEKKFKKERTELAQKLQSAQQADEKDVQATKKLGSENEQLRQAAAAEEKMRQLQAELAEAKKESQAARDSENALKAKYATASKIKKDKEFERKFAAGFSDLRAKIKADEALVRQKEKEIKGITAKGWRHFSKDWDKTFHTLEFKIKADQKSKASLEAKVANLASVEKSKTAQIAKLKAEKSSMEELLKKEMAKVTSAVSQENVELATAAKLETENKKLGASLKKVREVIPKFEKLEKNDQALQATNHELVVAERAQREKIAKLRKSQKKATGKVALETNKMNYAVDQENTEMLAVKILEGRNKHLKESLEDQVALKSTLQKAVADDRAKAATIRSLQADKAKTSSRMTSLLSQVSQLKHLNREREDEFIGERNILYKELDKDGTQTMSLNSLQKQNMMLKMRVARMADKEADEANAAKDSQTAAGGSDALRVQEDILKGAVEQMKKKDAALQQKESQLHNQIAALAAKSKQYEAALVQTPKKVVQKVVKAREDKRSGLQKVDDQLSSLVHMLHVH